MKDYNQSAYYEDEDYYNNEKYNDNYKTYFAQSNEAKSKINSDQDIANDKAIIDVHFVTISKQLSLLCCRC